MVSDTSYDAYLEGIHATKNEEQLAEQLTKIEDELEDVRHQIQTIEENCTYYVQDGQTRIKGYALEEQFEDLLAQEEDLEQQMSKLDEEMLDFYWDKYNCDEGVKRMKQQHNHWLWNSRAMILVSQQLARLSSWLWNQMYNKNR